MDVNKKSLELHKEKKGKLEIKSKFKLESKEDLSLAYTPGVAEPCREIAKDKSKVFEYTMKSNSVAVVSDGSAVLGLGNIGAEASLPVMEGKAILFKEFAGIDAFPICLDTQDPKKIIEIVKNIAPGFGGINLEDIKAPQCFEIEEALQNLGIPVMHDDQHGTAIVVLAALINSIKLVGKTKEEVQIVINGVGAAGIAISKLLLSYGFKKIIMADSKGVIYSGRDNLNPEKEKIAEVTNTICKIGLDEEGCVTGNLDLAMKGSDVFIGVSKGGIVSKEMIESMNEKSIVLAMANPVPEIMPDLAKEAGAFIVATGRSDFPNQVNNVLAFPGIFRGALDIRSTKITEEMKLSAAIALAEMVQDLSADNIIPDPLNKDVASVVAEAVKSSWKKD